MLSALSSPPTVLSSCFCSLYNSCSPEIASVRRWNFWWQRYSFLLECCDALSADCFAATGFEAKSPELCKHWPRGYSKACSLCKRGCVAISDCPFQGEHPISFCHLPYGMERNFRDRFSKYLKNNCFSHFSSLPDNKGKRMQRVYGKERAEIAVRQVNWKSLSELWKGSNTEVVLQQVATQHKHIPPQQHIL